MEGAPRESIIFTRELLLGYILKGKDRHFGNAISGQLLCFDVIAKRIFGALGIVRARSVYFS